MRSILVTLALTAICMASACGGSHEPLVRRPQSYEDHLASAEDHAARAEAKRRTAPAAERDPTHPVGYQCGDVALSDQTTSGGERLVQAVPCWDTTEKSVAQYRWGAAHEDRLADADRRAAASLLEAERTACRGLRERDLERSPFAHRREIADVVPHRRAGVLRGVRIVWKPVLGLTVGWMRQAIACHRARFERLGEPATYLPEDPTLVAHATTTVEQHGGHLEVLIETSDDISSHVMLGRARDLIGPRTATR
jgi:hypothetical protein